MRADLAHALATAFLRASWRRPDLVGAGREVVGRRATWLTPLAHQVLAVYRTAPLDRPRELATVIATLPAAVRAGNVRPAQVGVAAPTVMVTNPWHLPELHALSDVVAWTRLSPNELDWFADPAHLARQTRTEQLLHYRVSTERSASGSVRVLEAPKLRLKTLQRRLLHEVLAGIPQHEAAHGFVAGRSVATYAEPHAGQPVVIRLDLESFFASVTAGRVFGTFRAAGYPEPVAHVLTGLVTTVLPRHVWAGVDRPHDAELHAAHWRLGRRLAAAHLPQGAPTSPALANLAAHRLDRRLTGLVAAWGGRYTRYADDLALSGPGAWRHGTSRLLDQVEAVVVDEGFRLNARKTAVLPAAGRQVLGGLVVNQRPHVGRAEVDRLRAVLHNCAVHGASTQNRLGQGDFRAHLTGRVAWVAQHDPARGTKLREQLAAIDWSR